MDFVFLFFSIVGVLGLIVVFLYVIKGAKKTSSIVTENKIIITEARERYEQVNRIKGDSHTFAFDDAEILAKTYIRTIEERFVLLLLSILACLLAFIFILLENWHEMDSNGIVKLIIAFLQGSFFFLLRRKDNEIRENKSNMLKAKMIIMELDVISYMNDEKMINIELAKTLKGIRKAK